MTVVPIRPARPVRLVAPLNRRSERSAAAAKPVTTQLKLGLMVALVVGSILGSGVFGLPQNMAAGAGAGAILIGWAITGVGMLMLALVYQTLALRRPDLDNGVYAYARALSGEYVGFNAAWGYWVSAWIGNVGYLVAAFGALGMFFPIFGEGNTPASVLGASVLLWSVHAHPDPGRGHLGRGHRDREGNPEGAGQPGAGTHHHRHRPPPVHAAQG